jgi:hypothetical protein
MRKVKRYKKALEHIYWMHSDTEYRENSAPDAFNTMILREQQFIKYVVEDNLDGAVAWEKACTHRVEGRAHCINATGNPTFDNGRCASYTLEGQYLARECELPRAHKGPHKYSYPNFYVTWEDED